MGTTREIPKGFMPWQGMLGKPDNASPRNLQHERTWKPGDPKLPGYDYPGEAEYERDRDTD